MFDTERIGPGVLLEGLMEMAPGPGLAAVLEAVELDQLSGYNRVLVLQSWQRQIGHDQAQFYAAMMGVSDALSEVAPSDDLGDLLDAASMEIRPALAITRRAAEFHLGLAHELCRRLPIVWLALNAGWIDLPKARLIIDQTIHVDEATARSVAESVLEVAGSMTTGQLRARLARLVIQADPDSARKRYEHGVEERRLSANANPDGTANLGGWQLPAAEA